MNSLRVAVILTHPVQYYSPLFRELASQITLRVFYAHRPTAREQGTGFDVPFEWDIDLTSGYDHVWLDNRASSPDATRFNGCDVPDVGRELAEWLPDVVLLFGWHSKVYLQALAAARRARLPVVVRGDSQLGATPSRVRRALKQVAYPMLVRQFAACIAVGRRSEEYFHAYGARAVFRSPHFVDNEFFASRADGVRATARARFGLTDDAFVVLFAGKLIPMKRPLDVVAAAALARSPNVQVLVAGAGRLEQQMLVLALRTGVSIRLAGFLNQTVIPMAYAASDVLVLPSTAQETWGLVVNEAMACERPAIVSAAVGCAPDLVENGVTGYVVAEGDVTVIGERIALLAGRPELVQALGRGARERVASFNVSVAAAGVLDACEYAAVSKSGRGLTA